MAILALAPPNAQAEAAGELITQWYHENSQCNGGAANAALKAGACAQRETIREQLVRSGYCFGQRGEAGYQMRWHACNSKSLH